MAQIKTVVAEAGRRLGLRAGQRPGIGYGVKDGYLDQVAAGKADGTECAVEIVRYMDASRDSAVRSTVLASEAVSGGAIKAKNVQIGDGLVVHRRPRRLFRSFAADRIVDDVQALLGS